MDKLIADEKIQDFTFYLRKSLAVSFINHSLNLIGPTVLKVINFKINVKFNNPNDNFNVPFIWSYVCLRSIHAVLHKIMTCLNLKYCPYISRH